MPKSAMKKLIPSALALFAVVAAASMAPAQDYPTRPITLVVPYAAGGGNDVMGRIVGEKMSRTLGQQVVIDNRPGAGGALATRQVAKATPDGYTLVIGNTGTNAASYVLHGDLKYAPDSFAPVGLAAKTVGVLAIKKDFPAQTLAGFVA